MIKTSNKMQILETSLCPYPAYCDKATAEKLIAALQYQDFLKQEMVKTEAEIKQLCTNIEKKISYSTPHNKKF
ncbi:MAG: hypothetical protein MJZ50_07535 [Treponema sp.]|nr:hypothetical protein [Treponema sp.]